MTEFTRLLGQWKAGDHEALNDLMRMAHGELAEIARYHMRGERSDHTLQTQALVNEAFLRLHGAKADTDDRRHFMRIASRVMRQVLVDHARKRHAAKRGSDPVRLTLSERLLDSDPDQAVDIVDLDRALTELAALDERKATIVEARFFGGLSIEETAVTLDISVATVKREWRFARAWLFDQLSGGDG